MKLKSFNTKVLIYFQVNLTNDVFDSRLRATIGRARREHLYCDLTVCCAGQMFPVHKLVMAASSSLFSDLLRGYEHPNPLIGNIKQ